MSLLRLATQHNHKCKKILPDVPPCINIVDKFKGRLEIYASTCPKDKREETAAKHALLVQMT
jgi:hypothetical protein